jgi:MoxR-like ATPase
MSRVSKKKGTSAATQSEEPGQPPRSDEGTVPESLLTRPLGLEGWQALEPVVFAALISGDPLLLVGRHGTAKSFLLERLAQALGLVFRFYNTSLVNYDDLVGIPVPTEDQSALRYITTPSAIWDAEVVFMDELSRARPELQNKVFPIIHERRIQGVELSKLRYRWAAMNPPPPVDGGVEDAVYLGAEPLDPALADRFPFIVQAPDWDQLTDEERRRVLLDQFRGRHEFPVAIGRLLERGQQIFAALTSAPPASLADYLIALAPHAGKAAGSEFSIRRVTMLLRSILAVHAARVVLAEAGGKSHPAWSESAWLAVSNGLPAVAQGIKVDSAALFAAHRHAWHLCGLDATDPWRQLLAVPDAADRLALACRLGAAVPDLDFGRLITEALAAQPNRAFRTTLALVAYLRLHRERELPGVVVETLATELDRVFGDNSRHVQVYGNQLAACREVASMCATFTTDPTHPEYERQAQARALLNSLLPDGFAEVSPAEVLQRFSRLWEQFELVTPDTSALPPTA